MIEVTQNYYDTLLSRDTELFWLVEVYDPTTTVLQPENAVRRWAFSHEQFRGSEFEARIKSMGALNIISGQQANTASLTLDNNDNAISRWMLQMYGSGNKGMGQGLRLVIRLGNKRTPNEAPVRFVARVSKPPQKSNDVSVSLRQDLGDAEADTPDEKLEKLCALRSKFKGDDCTGATPYELHTEAWRSAVRCDGRYEGNCLDYGNQVNAKMIRIVVQTGTNTYTTIVPSTSFFGRLFRRKKKQVNHEQYSTQDSTAYGDVMTSIRGRAQIEFKPLMHADIGPEILFYEFIARGQIHSVVNLRNRNADQGEPFSVTIHLGEFGGVGTQTADPLFPLLPLANRMATISGKVVSISQGSGDPAPEITGVVLGEIIEVPSERGLWLATKAWSDNLAAHVRDVLLRDARMPRFLLDDSWFARTAFECDRPVLDDTQTQQVFYPTTQTPDPAILDYGATGQYDTQYFLSDGTMQASLPIERTDYNPNNPPQTFTPIQRWRKQWTCNGTVTDSLAVNELLNKKMLPAGDLFFSWTAEGRMALKPRTAAKSALLRGDVAPGARRIPVENIFDWSDSLSKLVLVGAGLATGEVVKLDSTRAWEFSPLNEQIPIATSGDCFTSHAAFQGGSTDAPYTATLTVSAVATATVIIDGVSIEYQPGASDTIATIAASLAVRINADFTLSRYVRATWDTDATVTLTGGIGSLRLADALQNPHAITEECLAITAQYQTNVDGGGIIGNVSWPNVPESLPNRVIVKYHDAVNDFAETEYTLDDRDAQEFSNTVKAIEIDGAFIDNESQARRLASRALARALDLAFTADFKSDRVAMLHDEGDLIALTDVDGDFVNLPLTVEKLAINSDFTVSITAQLYSTTAYLGDGGKSSPVLRLFTQFQ